MNSYDANLARPLRIGMLVFPGMDQIDFTGPFEIFARIPESTVHVVGTQVEPFRDFLGLTITPDCVLEDAPPLDLLQIPGGPGQQAFMHDERVLGLIRRHVDEAKLLYSVCTGALLCGAAGVLRGRRATTHWSAFELLPYFGAIPAGERVVVHGDVVSAEGVTAGLDGALTIAAMLRGDEAAQRIQLDIQYDPKPPFEAGSPATAPPGVLASATARYAPLLEARRATARACALRLGIAI